MPIETTYYDLIIKSNAAEDSVESIHGAPTDKRRRCLTVTLAESLVCHIYMNPVVFC